MIFLIIVFFTVTAVQSPVDPGDVHTITLENGQQLNIEEIPYSRRLPTSYYDQALSSIPTLYRDAVFVVKRRIGYFGNATSPYSLICYRETPQDPSVTITGVLQSKQKAWRYEATIPDTVFTQSLILILEEVSKIPFGDI